MANTSNKNLLRSDGFALVFLTASARLQVFKNLLKPGNPNIAFQLQYNFSSLHTQPTASYTTNSEIVPNSPIMIF